MSKQQQQQQRQRQQQPQQKEGMKSNKSLARPNQHWHDRRRSNKSKNDEDGASVLASSTKPNYRLSSSSPSGYFSLALIVAAAMKFSFMVGQYARTSLDIIHLEVPDPLISVLTLVQQPLTTIRESPIFYRQERQLPFTVTQATATGRQVVVTIDNVSEDFLSSEDSLTNAMMSLVEEELQQQQQHLVLLSHHCHHSSSSSSKKSNSIVSCVGILPDSHLLIHAWPLQNQVRIQFFTGSSSNSPLHDESIVAAIYKSFAMVMPHSKSRGAIVPPRLHSSIKLRGFSEPEQQQQLHNLGASDINATYVLTAFSEITPLTSVQHQQQQQHDEIYHEALVHPAMLVHPNPRRVAVIGSTDTVRQVLKHNTVETVVVFDFPKENSRIDVPVCLNDARVVVEHEDASSWFINRFSGDEEDALFDVVIIDSTADPFSSTGNAEMIDAIHNALSSQGVLVADVGVADRLGDAGWNYRNVHRLDMIKALQDANSQIVKTYTESSSSSKSSAGSSELRMFHIAFCDFDSKARWYMNQAEIDLELDKRMLVIPTAVSSNEDSSSPQLYNLDGATIMSYQYPTRIVEEVYCRQIPTPEECVRGHGFDPHTPNVPLTALEVKPSSIRGAGRGVFFKEDFAKGAYISIDSGVHGMNIMPSTFSLIVNMEKNRKGKGNSSSDTIGIMGAGDLWVPLESYVDGYGFEHLFYGKESSAVDPGIITFVNHGCNGTNNIGSILNVTEMTADINVAPLDRSDEDSYDDEFYSPFDDRNHWIFTFTQDKTQVDVKAGMELLDNYLYFYANWTEGVISLRSECQGIVTGTVVDYERKQGKKEHV